ncbi:MAG: sigma-70 family RNA polymerase sigma factor [Planctomycetaceae bacterium]|nr:sigma-70 family RNA polymerase sigma factor [Planctomycetales bacterium]MCB9923586.1 sigma-70 family RNA polymerase sigma factor [Planctomycetaceae bacterium]
MNIATLSQSSFAGLTSRERSESDGALLRAFLDRRDDLAFAKLVSRHAGLVMGVCRRVLGNEQDAEDAFQATFLVLARKASSLKSSKSLPAWLHKTAHRIALRARADRARLREQPIETEAMTEEHSSLQRIAKEHERSALDEELNRLPVFLCCLEGKSREDAARQLGWSNGSLKGRLERARQLLRRRLILRGVSLSVAVALVLRSQAVVQAAVAPSVVATTVQASMRYSVGLSPVGYVSPNAHLLANWSLKAMSITSVKFTLCALLVTSTLILGANWMVVPVAAGSGGHEIVIQPTSAAGFETTFVALFDDDREEREREGARAEGDRNREREQPRRDSEEARRDGNRPREADERRDEEPRRESFRPQTEREEALYKMILQLQREVAALRSVIRSRDGEPARGAADRPREEPRRDGDRPRERDGDRPASSREGDRQTEAGRTERWELTKEGKVFKAYDKNGDRVVSAEEWLAMKEGEMTDERRALELRRFKEASGDGNFTLEKFLHWYTKGRAQNVREGERRDSEER